MIRIGTGYDIHRTQDGAPLFLGGVQIDSPFGLEGHSDADVLLHAIMDALLGAAALGDIGQHFPPSDLRYRGISSLKLLRTVSGLLHRAGYEVVNIDSVLIAESPRIGPYRERMQEVIGAALRIEPSRVGIKATTNEGVGPEGRREAISAQAVVLLRTAT